MAIQAVTPANTSALPAPKPGLGKRERNKAEKRLRIIEAAGALFKEKGFDATTTLEIAERAQIATGTLFLYVRSKEELVALTFRDEFLEEVDQAFRLVDHRLPFLGQLEFVFGAMIRYHARDMRLAGHLVKQFTFYQSEEIGEIVAVVQDRIIAGLKGLVMAQIDKRKPHLQVDPQVAASAIFVFYRGLLVHWVNGDGGAEAFQSALSEGLTLLVRGITADLA